MYASSQLEKLEDMFSRISAEGQIHSNLQSVISKLHNEGTLDRLHSEFKAIFENEVKYTLNILQYLKNKRNTGTEDFDLREQLFSNIYIFKENFNITLKIIVEDLWNSQLSNPNVLASMITTHMNPKDASKPFDTPGQQPPSMKQSPDKPLNSQPRSLENQKGQGTNSSNCFEIKEAHYEEEIESPKQRAENKLARTGAIQLTATPNTGKKTNDKSTPTQQTPLLEVDEIPNRLTYQGSDDNQKDTRRESKSVDNARTGPPLRKQTGDSKEQKGRADTTQAMYRKINMDIFAVAGGKKPAEKPKASAATSLQKRQASTSNLTSSKHLGSKKLLYSSYTHKPEMHNQTPTNLTEE